MDGVDDASLALILRLYSEDIDALEGGAGPSAGSNPGQRFQEGSRAPASVGRTIGNPQAGPSRQVAQAECTACSESLLQAQLCRTPCNHNYCRECLDHMFTNAMRGDQTAYPPRCCRQEISLDIARPILTAATARAYTDKKPELDDPNRAYCHFQTCSAYLSPANRRGKIGTCPRCRRRTCLDCKRAVHRGDCPDDPDIQATENLAQREGWRRCPQCSRMVELRVGCNHVTCHCRAEFCYVCGGPWTRNGMRVCECPMFDPERLAGAIREDRGMFRAPAELQGEGLGQQEQMDLWGMFAGQGMMAPGPAQVRRRAPAVVQAVNAPQGHQRNLWEVLDDEQLGAMPPNIGGIGRGGVGLFGPRNHRGIGRAQFMGEHPFGPGLLGMGMFPIAGEEELMEADVYDQQDLFDDELDGPDVMRGQQGQRRRRQMLGYARGYALGRLQRGFF